MIQMKKIGSIILCMAVVLAALCYVHPLEANAKEEPIFTLETPDDSLLALTREADTSTDYVFTLIPAEGYHTPETITITADGQLLTAGTDYGYVGDTIYLPKTTEAEQIIITAATTNLLTFSNEDISSYVLPVITGHYFYEDHNYIDVYPIVDLHRDGFVFNGWFESEDNGQTFVGDAYDLYQPVTSDTHLYANWSPTVKITFDLEKMKNSSSNQTALGQKYTVSFFAESPYLLPEQITVSVAGTTLDPTEYTLETVRMGSRDSLRLTIPAEHVTGDIHIQAAAVEAVNLYLKDSLTFNQKIPVAPGKTIFEQYSYLPSGYFTRTYDGYTFDGWYISPDEGETFTGEAFDFTKPIFEELTLYAKWTPIEESSDPDSTDSSTPNLESSSTDSNESSSPESSFTPDDSSTLENSSASGESSDSTESSLPASDSNIEHSGSNSGVSEESGNENSADTPATGDAGNMAMWTALILVFTALLTYMTSTARKAR